MKRTILDLHIHSKYSRACSKSLELESIAEACAVRGIDIVATGDMTHPKWFESIKTKLTPCNDGVYCLKDGSSSTKFLLGTEIALIKKHKDKTRRVHVCVFAPHLAALEKLIAVLENREFNLRSDGRPIIGMNVKDFLELLLEVDEQMEMIPAHAWTPWFGIFGSKGGYDSLEEAFDDLTPHIHAIETGLSSDPIMNWRVPFLDNITLVSNSDAHSTAKLGREANVFQFQNESDITYSEIMRVIHEGDRDHFLYTIEFYPEEGKYHMDGHRDCSFVCDPAETKKLHGLCPKCKRPLVVGVMNRVHALATRREQQAKELDRIPYKSLVPLTEILADVFECGVNTKKVATAYSGLIQSLGSEFSILLDSTLEDISNAGSSELAKAVERVRMGNIHIKPGYDGEFGVVKVFEDNESRGGLKQSVML